MENYQVTEFRSGSVFGRSFQLYLENFIPFTCLMILAILPEVLYAYFSDFNYDWFTSPPRILTSFVLELLASYLLIPAIIYTSYQSLRGEKPAFDKTLLVMIRCAIPVILTGLAMLLVFAAGLVLLIFPAIIWGMMYYVSIPVAVIEGEDPISSLKRSAALTDGYKWTLFGLGFKLGLVLLIPTYILAFALLGKGYPNQADFQIYFYSVMVLAVFVKAWQATAVAVAYYDLRWLKEGVGVEEYASIFD